MNEKELNAVVERVILMELARLGEAFVPVNISNRHVHLCQADVDRLFGAGYQLTKMRDLIQPGQYACNEKVTIETEKGQMSLRVVGPVRKETQIELTLTDAVKLGVKPPVRMSGDLQGSPGCVLSQGGRRITLDKGVIIAARHLHLSPDEAQAFGLKDGDTVSLRVEGPRAMTLDQVIVRSGQDHRMEAHIDTDEANACMLRGGQLCRVVYPQTTGGDSRLLSALSTMAQAKPAVPAAPFVPPKRDTMLDVSGEKRRLITEDDVRRAAEDGYKIIRIAPDAILTPLARDTAAEKDIQWAEARL